MLNISVVMTAYRRPEYLRETLASWSQVRGLENLIARRVCVDPSESQEDVARLAREYGWDVRVNASRLGVLVNPVESVGAMFREPLGADFVILAEEDVVVAADLLEYFAWAQQRFRADPAVMLVCAHTRTHELPGQPDQDVVRRLPGFGSVLIWGCWRGDWLRLIEPTWDRDYSSGNGPEEPGGWDHNLQRIMRRSGLASVAPDQSRSDHIGVLGGAHCGPTFFPQTQDPWYRPDVPPCQYRYAEEDFR